MKVKKGEGKKERKKADEKIKENQMKEKNVLEMKERPKYALSFITSSIL